MLNDSDYFRRIRTSHKNGITLFITDIPYSVRNLEHLDKELPDIIVSKDDKFYKMKNPENQSEIITVFPQKSNKPHILLDTNCIELEKVEVCDDKVYVRSAGIYQKIGGKYVFLDRTKEKTAYAKAKLLGLL